ncbi:hypothetical protein [Nocardia miyunensis]|uniref:hypothetical protein n=1 Tax=Nocardia miyunensis TaxID=282684 RepID=UPI0008361C00|nr:hypothetical protein [Nocardia miyunensis]
MRTATPGALLVLIMAQPNMATGMMPYYRHVWTLAPLLITVIFATYLFALAPALTVVGTPPTRSSWWWRIGVGAACGVGADVTMALAHSPWVACGARVLSGLSVGLVTGSLAGLILERRGERARTAVATATVFGSAVGTFAAATVAQYLPAPGVVTYAGHAVLLTLAALVVFADRAEGLDAAHSTPQTPQAIGPALEPKAVGYLTGTAAWVSAGLTIALLPSYGAALLNTGNLALLALPVTLYVVSAWVVLQVIPPKTIPAEPVVAQVIIVAGVSLTLAVSWVHSLPLLLCGGIVAGCGQGLGYRAGLQIASAATPPDQHARATSRFAAVAYLFAAIATIALGLIATVASMRDGVLAGTVILAVLTVTTALVRRRASSRAADPALISQPTTTA